MEDNTCSMLRAAVKELKQEIDMFVSPESSTDSEQNVVSQVFCSLLEIVTNYYKQIDFHNRAMTFAIISIVSNLDLKFYEKDDEKKEFYVKNKKLFSIALLLWIRTKFLGLIHSKTPFGIEPNPESTDERNIRKDNFVSNLCRMITETKNILKDKNEKDRVLVPVQDKKIISFPHILKPVFNIGRETKYQSLLKHAQATGAEATGAEATGAEATPKLYFLMLYTLGIIAIQLCDIHYTITSDNINEKVNNFVVYKTLFENQLTVSPPDSSPGGATSRRRRRSHSSLHSRKSINRNKKSKKIRKLYTSKHRVRPRNRNKPKNKSMK